MRTWRIQSSICELPDVGFVFVHHYEGEDPVEVIKKYAAGEDRVVGGPFSTMEEAMAAGTAALNETMQRLKERGVKVRRPGPKDSS